MKKDDVPPYNRCDYRCERCDEAEDCAVFKTEELRRMTRELACEDPDDPECFAEDLMESFESAESLIRRVARERGIDLDSAAAEAGKERGSGKDPVRDHPLYRQAMDAALRCVDFAKDCEDNVFISPEIRPLFDEIVWYAPLFAAKTARAVSSLGAGRAAGTDAADSIGVARKALAKCRNALEQIAVYRPKTSDLSSPLLIMIDGIEERLRSLLSAL